MKNRYFTVAVFLYIVLKYLNQMIYIWHLLNKTQLTMKKFKLISVFFAIIAALSFTGCQNEELDQDLLENVGEEQPAGPASFKVDFGGQTYVATVAAAQFAGGSISITGVRGTTGESILIVLPGNTTGTYNSPVINYLPSGTSTNTYTNLNPASGNEPNGQVVITNINTTSRTISGTFNFTGYFTDESQNLPPVVFSSGSFQNVPYTGDAPNPNPNPGPTTKFLKAKIDGTMTNFVNVTVFHLMDTYRIAGTNTDNSLSISVPDDITAGTYELGENLDGVTAGYIPSFGADAYYSLPGGSITITSVSNGWISGTFNFTGEDFDGATVTVTEGSFNAQLP